MLKKLLFAICLLGSLAVQAKASDPVIATFGDLLYGQEDASYFMYISGYGVFETELIDGVAYTWGDATDPLDQAYYFAQGLQAGEEIQAKYNNEEEYYTVYEANSYTDLSGYTITEVEMSIGIWFDYPGINDLYEVQVAVKGH